MSVSVPTSVGGELGRFTAELTLSDVPGDVLEKLRCNVLHNLACAMGAHTAGAALWDGVRDRRPAEATLLCDGDRVAAEHAAFANAALMHTRAQDDTHFAAKTHVGSAVMPALGCITVAGSSIDGGPSSSTVPSSRQYERLSSK